MRSRKKRSSAAIYTKSCLIAGFSLALIPTASASQHGAVFIPMEVDLVNRDDLTQTWTADAQKQTGAVTIYAGTTTGDEVAWKLTPFPSWLSGTFTWTATDSLGNVINGPTGVGVDYWQISDTGGNDPANGTTLTWKPDTYTIKCSVLLSSGVTIPIQYIQKVGWRTEDYLVIGQIVNTNTFMNSGPADSAASTAFDTAITVDCSGVFTLINSNPLSSLLSIGLPDKAFGFIEFGGYGVWPHTLTSHGPLSFEGAITEGDRYWMLENTLNASVDDPTAPTTIAASGLDDTMKHGFYRLFHHYQTRFTLTSAGNMDTTSFYDIHNDAITGQTKFNIPANAFSPIWNNPTLPLFTLAAQTNPIDSIPNKGAVQTSSDGTKHSSYASGRVGNDGQNVNWHVFGQDVPWIYSEIICHVAADHTVSSDIKMSVNKDWQDSGGLSGDTNFNNLNIYKAVLNPDTGLLYYVSQHDSPLLMKGQLQNFITSVPIGTWPTPPPAPSVQ